MAEHTHTYAFPMACESSVALTSVLLRHLKPATLFGSMYVFLGLLHLSHGLTSLFPFDLLYTFYF